MTIENLQKAFNENFETVKAALEKSGRSNAEISERLTEIEQRLVAPTGGGGNYAKSWGAQVAESEQFKSLQLTRSGRAFVELKTTITTGSTSGGPLATSDRLPMPEMMPQRRVRIRDLVSPGRTNSTAIDYAQQTTRTINAAHKTCKHSCPPAPVPRGFVISSRYQKRNWQV